MKITEKKKALLQLGIYFDSCILHSEGRSHTLEQDQLNALVEKGAELIQTAHGDNAWFTASSVKSVFSAWSNSLKAAKIDQWLNAYETQLEDTNSSKIVGVIMAGNLPLVGLHDALCVLIVGHSLRAKLSSKDKKLMSLVIDVLKEIDSAWAERIEISDILKGIDFLIATGSDNSARYFEYYFKDTKKIIRKNRTSIAILDGKESAEDLELLSEDVFTHFGLGCRNVTKVYLPKDFDLDRLFNAFYAYKDIGDHNKYANNYDYNKAVYLMNKIELIENGFLLLKEDEGLHSPLAVLFYEFYEDINEVIKKVDEHAESLQCIVSKLTNFDGIPFGKAQSPELWDYSDGIDTIDFLIEDF